MKNKLKILVAVITTVFTYQAYAGDINWAGRYRVESHLLKNPRLTSASNDHSYLNHHLVLSPHVIAADGITIHTRFDIFNNSDYPNSQFGQFFGGSGTTTNAAATGEMDSETIAVTELYLSWVHQFGSLIAGRAPVHFGLGLTHNAGNGEFDHWFDRKDLIGYKIVMGNMYLLPMYGKIREGGVSADDDIKDYMIQVAYENLDTDLEIGLFYQQRSAGAGGNDLTITDPIFNNPVPATHGDLSVKTYNLFVKKKRGDFDFGVEASMQSGSTGLVAGGTNIDIDASAVVAEIGYKPQGSKWSYDLKLGSISGDSRDSAATYEGYLVNRNYDVSMLMFNYVLGTGAGSIFGNENYIDAITSAAGKEVDVGQMSNVIYLAPGFKWDWSDKWSLNGRFLYAQLIEEQHPGQSTDLGYEFDVGVYHRPFDRFVIGVDLGYLVAGDAFKGPGTYENKNAYGVITKAAISF